PSGGGVPELDGSVAAGDEGLPIRSEGEVADRTAQHGTRVARDNVPEKRRSPAARMGERPAVPREADPAENLSLAGAASGALPARERRARRRPPGYDRPGKRRAKGWRGPAARGLPAAARPTPVPRAARFHRRMPGSSRRGKRRGSSLYSGARPARSAGRRPAL